MPLIFPLPALAVVIGVGAIASEIISDNARRLAEVAVANGSPSKAKGETA